MNARMIPIFKIPSFVYGTIIVDIAFKIGNRITRFSSIRSDKKLNLFMGWLIINYTHLIK